MDFSSHRKTGVVHSVKLVVSEKLMHENRLAVHGHFVRVALHGARVRRIRDGLGGGHHWQEHQEQGFRAPCQDPREPRSNDVIQLVCHEMMFDLLWPCVPEKRFRFYEARVYETSGFG